MPRRRSSSTSTSSLGGPSPAAIAISRCCGCSASPSTSTTAASPTTIVLAESFQLTHTEAKTLVRNAATRYCFELEGALRANAWGTFDAEARADGNVYFQHHCVVGCECDGCELTLEDGLPAPMHADGCPPGFEVLATAPARLYSVDVEAGVNEYPTGLQKMRTVGELQGVAHVLFGDASPAKVRREAHGNAVLGTYEAGDTVVTTGCRDWAYGVAGGDPIVHQITRNILDRLGS